MVVRVYRRESLQRGIALLGFVLVTLWFLAYPHALSTGISRGLSVCSSIIIPTLYPFMLLAGALTDSALCRNPGRWMERVTRWLFGLPGCCGPAVLLGLLGGYPAGALAIGRLLEQKQITPQEAARMLRFCINAGPGFVISTVGAGLLGSTRAGLLLFAAHAGTSLITGVWLGRGHRRESTRPSIAPPAARPTAQMVGDTCRALLTMCGFVVAAAALLTLLESSGIALCLQQITTIDAGCWSAATAALLEVSCGCVALVGAGEWAPFWLSLCMGWGGLAVHGQLRAALGKQGVPALSFVYGRVLHGFISGIAAVLLFWVFPADLPTVGGQTQVLPHTVSAAASVMLLILSFLAMCVFSAKSTGKTQKDVV